MSSGNVYKPRYTLPYLAKSKVWPVKNSRLRRFISLRGRRLQRGGLFRRYVLVLKTIKWSEARRQIRPIRRRTGYGIAGGGITAFGRPRKRRYRDSFYTKQQVRAFHGKRSEASFRSIAQTNRTGVSPITGAITRSFAASLGSRLDILLFRIRILPTIYACHQFIRHVGISINGSLTYAPQSFLRIGDTISIVPSAGSEISNKTRLEIWRTIYWDLFVRLYYRRWGLFILRRRTLTQLRSKVRRFSRPIAPRFPLIVSSARSNNFNQGRIGSTFQSLRTRLSITKGFNDRQLTQFRHLLKVWLSLRLRSSRFPRLRSSGFPSDSKNDEVFTQYIRPSRRKSLRRFRIARRIKTERRRKLIRLQPVHRLFPSYLQIDLRTLRATKIYEPTSEDLFFPFLGSVAQVQAFYHSRGR